MENVANKKNMPDGVETIEDLVRHSLDQDYNKANMVFGDLMSDKLNTVLDQAKMKIAGNIYNGDPEEEDDGLYRRACEGDQRGAAEHPCHEVLRMGRLVCGQNL